MEDSATRLGKICVQVAGAEAFRYLNEHCSLNVHLQDAVGIGGARGASTGTTPVESGISSIRRGANVIVIAIFTAKVPV